MNNLGNEMTFWSLIEKYSICIPIIQRDYVQGRNNEQVIDARRKLLHDMRVSIETCRNLDLNFVYGKVHEKNKFIPLDGQQRLTTLFLLHWFSISKARDYSKMITLKKFTYETRISSKNFIKQLIAHTESLSDAVADINQKISEYVQNEEWFWVEWSYDPTIESILLMLDEIKINFNDVDDLCNKLTSENYISFRFLNMLDIGMEDSLYIKLNARGRPLTDFENFKAELVKYIEKAADDKTMSLKIPPKKYKMQLDGQWTDLIWHLTDGNKENFDKIYMNCFHWILWNRWAETQNVIEKSNSAITTAMNKNDYFRLKIYEENQAIDVKVLETIYYTLEYFSFPISAVGGLHKASDINGIEYFQKCLLYSGTTVTYEDRVMLFAITCYFEFTKGMADSTLFIKWLRVLRNLVRNSRLDGLDDFVRAVKSISAFSIHCTEILEYLASPNCSIGAFLNEQIDEERLKAILILRDNDWATAIYEAEQHPYFAGQIAFLFSFAGVSLKTIDDLSDIALAGCLTRYATYQKKTSAIFNDKGLTINANLFSRAVLSKGDYLLAYRRCKSFLVGNHRDISWKMLMRNSNAQKRAFMKDVLDELDEKDLSMKTIEKRLNEIIENAAVDGWRHYFVKMGKLLENCGYYRLIYESETGRILLVSCQTTAGCNKEYYTFVLYLKLLSSKRKPFYVSDRGQYGDMFIDKIDDKDIIVKYANPQNNANGEFQINFNGSLHSESSVDDSLKFIDTLV